MCDHPSSPSLYLTLELHPHSLPEEERSVLRSSAVVRIPPGAIFGALDEGVSAEFPTLAQLLLAAAELGADLLFFSDEAEVLSLTEIRAGVGHLL